MPDSSAFQKQSWGCWSYTERPGVALADRGVGKVKTRAYKKHVPETKHIFTSNQQTLSIYHG